MVKNGINLEMVNCVLLVIILIMLIVCFVNKNGQNMEGYNAARGHKRDRGQYLTDTVDRHDGADPINSPG